MSDLLYRLRNAARGSAELSAEVLTCVTGREHWCGRFDNKVRTGDRSWSNFVSSVTESLDAAWKLAEAEGCEVGLYTWWDMDDKDVPVRMYSANLRRVVATNEHEVFARVANTPALAICAALVAAAEGKETHA